MDASLQAILAEVSLPAAFAKDTGLITLVSNWLKLPKRCDINQVDEAGWTLLHAASKAGYVNLIRFLLENGADPSISTRASRNLPFHLLVKSSLIVSYPLDLIRNIFGDLLKPLHLETGLIDVNCTNSRGENILHQCIFGKAGESLMSLLISIPGLDINNASLRGVTPLRAAIQRSSPGIVRLLLSRGAVVSFDDIALSHADHYPTGREIWALLCANSPALVDAFRTPAVLPPAPPEPAPPPPLVDPSSPPPPSSSSFSSTTSITSIVSLSSDSSSSSVCFTPRSSDASSQPRVP